MKLLLILSLLCINSQPAVNDSSKPKAAKKRTQAAKPANKTTQAPVLPSLLIFANN